MMNLFALAVHVAQYASVGVKRHVLSQPCAQSLGQVFHVLMRKGRKIVTERTKENTKCMTKHVLVRSFITLRRTS